MTPTIQDKHLAREAKKYNNPIPSREYILSVIKRHKRCNKDFLIQSLTLNESQFSPLNYRLKAMLRDNQVSINHQGEFTLFIQKPTFKGEVIANPKGFGFVKLEMGGRDLRLSPIQMQTVFHSETVMVRRFDDRNGAQVVSVEDRIKTLVGRLVVKQNKVYLQVDDKRILQTILVKNSAKKYQDGQFVVAKIIRYPSKNELTQVKIIKLLGHYLDKGVEVQSALLRYGIKSDFDQQVQSESEALPNKVLTKDKKNRKDLSHLPLVTIDGEDSRDFDDAVYAKKEGKNIRLWVAIADVSHYVHNNQPLDKEAKIRTTSVYFPNQVVPMLPEKISNELCSLNPEVLRLCLVCELLISPKSMVLSSEFYPGVMKSYARLTYTEVANILVDKNKDLIKKYQNVYDNLLTLDVLYELLALARIQRGAMVFNRAESQILFNKNGKITNIIAKYSNKAHRIIEECMLLANQTCAQFLDKHNESFLYRIHPKPSDEKLQNLTEFLLALDIDVPDINLITPKVLSEILTQTKHRQDAHIIQTMILRSMQQAVYTTNNVGHFGLAFEQYAHFTSPIRRYPDLLVHRAIKRVLNKEKPSKILIAQMVKLGEICSQNERNADEASRDVEKWLKCEFMSHRINKQYQGTISGVTNFGLFVELNDIFVDGLILISNLKEDYFVFNQQTQSLVGKTSNKTYALGDSVRVKISKVNLDERKIELVLDVIPFLNG